MKLESADSLEKSLGPDMMTSKAIKTEFKKIKKMYKQLNHLCKTYNVHEGITIEQMFSEDYFSFLGLSLIGHDLKNKAQPVSLYSMLNDKTADKLLRKNPRLFKGYLEDYDYLRSGIATIAYIVTGDSRFRLKFERDEFIMNIGNLKIPGLEIVFDFDEAASLWSDQYFPVRQIVKKSRDAVKDAQKYAAQPGKTNVRASVVFNDYKTSSIFTISDDSYYIPEEQMLFLFEPFSTDSACINGLQIAKRIVELSNGWIDIVSAEPGKIPLFYNTVTDSVNKYNGKLDHGTEFKLVFAK